MTTKPSAIQPSLQPTCYGEPRPLPQASELQRLGVTGTNLYTARIPFRTPPSTRVAEEESSAELGGVQYTLKWNGQHHVLVVAGFASEEAAREFIRRAHASFAWLLLQKGIAADVNLEPQPTTYFEDPVAAAKNISGSLWNRVDCIVHGDQAAIYPTGKEVRVATGHLASVCVTVPAAHALATLVQGAERAFSNRVADDERLSVASALYGAYFSEHSAKARFLTLVMALESLALAEPKAPIAIQLIDSWQQQLNALRQDAARSPDEVASLDSLERELLFRREDSVRSQIRRLIRASLAAAPDVEQASRDPLRLYDLRSRLVHEGHVEPRALDNATGQAKDLVRRVLMARFDSVAGPAEPSARADR